MSRRILIVLSLGLALVLVSCDDNGSKGVSGPELTPISGAWEWQNPLPHGNALHDVTITPDGVTWAVGAAGILQRSYDYGLSWSEQASGTNYDLTSIDFVDEQRGWIVGGFADTETGLDCWPDLCEYHAVILHTENGGETWESQYSPVATKLNDVFFLDSLHGWAGGFDGMLLSTTNGGDSWSWGRVAGYSPIQAVHFSTLTSGHVVVSYEYQSNENGQILRLVNGNYFQLAYHSDVPIYDISFLNDSTGFAVGKWGTVIQTTNGDDWYETQTVVFETLRQLSQNAGHELWAVGDNGAMLRYDTLWGYWYWVSTGTTAALRGVAFAESGAGVAVGESGVILTSPTGYSNSWTATGASAVTVRDLYNVSFVNEYSGWACGDSGLVLHTSDGGQSWAAQESGTNVPLLDIAFVSEARGWAVGGRTGANTGVMLHTADGGLTWDLDQLGGIAGLSDIQMIDDQNGWVLGRSNFLLRTTNGGAEWLVGFALNSSSHADISFVTDSIGWVLTSNTSGSTSHIRTTSAGQYWNQRNITGFGPLYGVALRDQRTGWVCGDNGVILHTTDEGNSWSIQSSGTGETLLDLYFIDSAHGWAVGEQGTIVMTNDGVEWTAASLRVSNKLNAIAVIASGHAWVVGDGGTILHFTPTQVIL